MGKVIITTTPTATRSGQAIVASTDPNDARPNANLLVEFTTGLPNMNIGDIVECKITSAIACELIRVVGPSVWAQGIVTAIGVGDHLRGEFQVDILCDPNPFGAQRGEKLLFNNPNSQAKVGDTVGCIPTTVARICEVMQVLVPA